jgi:hypothetical protein
VGSDRQGRAAKAGKKIKDESEESDAEEEEKPKVSRQSTSVRCADRSEACGQGAQVQRQGLDPPLRKDNASGVGRALGSAGVRTPRSLLARC